MTYHNLCNFSSGEKNAVFHADNCGGKNRKKTVIHYFTWRVGKGLHQEINYHFVEPGHTKCICDGCFGKIRQFRRIDVDTPPQLSSLIEHSARINSSVMYRDSFGEETNFQCCGWDSYFNSVFSLCWPFGNITICGLPMRTLVMFMSRKVSDTEEKHVCVLKRGVSWPPALPEFPEPLPAVGFTEERLKYL